MRIKWFSLVRITGLIMVLAYHFYPKQVTGGFVGVDLFFVFSGFLITSLIIDEFAKQRHFDLLAFYRRRFNRIVPPLWLSVTLVLPLSLLINRDFLTNIGKQVAAALGFVTNYYEILTGGNYENQFMPHLFVHTWTLALEMHFYILWGLLVWFLVQYVKRSRFNRIDRTALLRLRIGQLSAVFILIQLALIYVQIQQKTNLNIIYFSDLTHAFPFFIGALLASLTGIRQLPNYFKHVLARTSVWGAMAGMLLGLVLLAGLTALLKFDQVVTYQWGFLLASLGAALMIVSARILHDKTPNIEEPRPITFLADTSYSVYLYHWPLIIIFGHLMNHDLAVLLTITLSLTLSALSYYVIEPILTRPKTKPLWHRSALGLMTILAGVTFVICWQAPKMSNLSQHLWQGNLQQDVDQLHSLADNTTTQTGNNRQIPKGTSVIGDSVTLGTRAYLSTHLADSSIDAQPNRNMTQANQILANQIRNKTLRQNVIICIGTNSLNDYQDQLMKLINTLPAGHRLILMTPFDGQANASWNSSKLAVLERTLPDKYPFITIADWNRLAGQHREIFGSGDGTHFAGNADGDKLYAQCLNDALVKAEKGPVKK
ncbi:acyltransferase family protein [Convivina intestini]|uniref:Peptidoglycan/LPS O-acetylase OafA/YrhL n=1 Tax=Convivina intestini TaxID=1505726 RepID=A0A2U1D9J2_9LACO|nr:acyltransferase family protein [Convivina intestini]PVY84351.1 peptidoglycan/LPS O-acetylase OafA/YrhL [Convivina intestini]CAH1857076.1 O-acetyltransferase OatA [Convivina intestini]SDC06782.1 Peptidoglycan/LPS O-acetylase OafA/YrhL, contains acyltransferase and SGNH-hydrolase domains [Leuconostocaceae bacterium R-53105]